MLLFQEWQDEFFKWDPKDYNGTEFITVPSSSIWLPDFVLYNRYVITYVITGMLY